MAGFLKRRLRRACIVVAALCPDQATPRFQLRLGAYRLEKLITALLILIHSSPTHKQQQKYAACYYLAMTSIARWRDQWDDGQSASGRAGEKLRLLSLDNGGIRGLSTLFLLKHILSRVGSPKPHEFFHMIAGTGSGGYVNFSP